MVISIDILNQYFNDGWLMKQSHPTLPLIIWNYTPKTQYESKWDEITLSCRGLVTNFEGKVIGKPFEKFFNIEENKHIPTKEFEVFEKMDGSLGIVFKYEGQVVYATRGSFSSDQAKWMSNYGKEYSFQDILVDGFTYLFEIIYPENRIVVDYGSQERLVLLGIIKTETGEEIPYDDIVVVPWDIVQKYDGIKDYSTLKGLVDNNAEGFVVRFSNGSRMKIKGEEYLRLHKIMTNLSTTSVWEILSNNGKIDEFIKDVPDEFFKKIQDYAFELSLRHFNISKDYTEYFETIKEKFVDRKSFAEESKRYQHPSLLFSLLDGKDISPLIWKIVKPDFKKL